MAGEESHRRAEDLRAHPGEEGHRRARDLRAQRWGSWVKGCLFYDSA